MLEGADQETGAAEGQGKEEKSDDLVPQNPCRPDRFG